MQCFKYKTQNQKRNHHITINNLTRNSLLKVRKQKKATIHLFNCLKAMYIINNCTTLQPFVFPSLESYILRCYCLKGRAVGERFRTTSKTRLGSYLFEYNSWGKCVFV